MVASFECTLWEPRRSQVFCDYRCRQRAYRRRRVGLEEDAYSLGPGGESARRGRVPMWRPTRDEVAELERLFGAGT